MRSINLKSDDTGGADAGRSSAGRMPFVCMRSFFNGLLSRRYNARRTGLTAALTLFLALAAAVFLANTKVGFAVYVNGEQIGKARTMEDVTAVVTDAEQRLKEILGRDYSLDGAVSVSADLGKDADNAENLREAILGSVEDVCELFVLEVDGKVVGASGDEQTLTDILNNILNDYTTDQTASVGFTGTVTVRRDYVSRDITQDPAIIEQMLRPGNAASSCALTVESTELTQHTETVPYEVTSVNDASIYVGSSVVKTKGVPGEMIVTEKTTYRNGAALSTVIVGRELITAPVTEVVAVGTAPRPKTASYGTYIWPTEGIITSTFGPRTGFGSNNHQGIDIAGTYGENIVASDGGEVILAECYYGYGLMVQILHDNGDVTYYAHCSDLLVEEGERVYQGQVIAQMGRTGVASGVHCHFEIRRGGEPVDPLSLLP